MFLFDFNNFVKDLWSDLKDVWGSYKWVLISAAALIALFLLLFIIACVKSSKNKKALRATKNLLEKQSSLDGDEPVDSTESVTEDTEVEDVAVEEEVAEENKVEEPVTEEPEVEDGAVEEEVAEEAEVEEPVTEEPEVEGVAVEEEVSEETEVEEPVTEESEVEEVAVEEEVAEETEAEEPVTEEPEIEETKVKEVVAEESKTEEPVAEEPVAEESTPKPENKTKKTSAKKKTTENTTTDDKTPAVEEKKAPKTNSRVKGKYEIVSSTTGFVYTLKASNGESLIVSEAYTTLKGCKTAIKRLQENSKDAELRIEEDKNKNFQFHVVKGTRIVAHSANYSTKTGAVNASKSFMKFVDTDVIKVVESDEANLELVDLSNAEISSEKTGKIVIYNSDGVLTYKLIANNGQIICTSPTYKTMSALNGSIAKFQEAVYNGKFYILKDKNGNHQFKLYSATNRLIMTGESFTSIDNAKSNVASCYRFAKNATIEVAEAE